MVGGQAFLSGLFKEYYSRNPVSSVPEIEAREFGVGEFGKKITKRHLSFSSEKEFNAFLSTVAPFFVSCSLALYRQPSVQPMEAKQLFGADLVYEFDAGDIKTDCKKNHDSWNCQKCNTRGRGNIKACTSCGQRVLVSEWFCPQCLDETKNQVFRLLDFLENDFGFSEGISVNFSGNAGYHVHVRNSLVRELSSDARIELVDYLTATGFLPEAHGFFLENKRLVCPFIEHSAGWGKRAIKEIVSLIEENKAEEIALYSHSSLSAVKDFLKNRENILSTIKEKRLLPPLSKAKQSVFWLRLIDYIVEKNAVKIDRQTSVDIKKIIRVPGTIHGSTGLLAKAVPVPVLKAFDPLKEAVVFSSEKSERIFINKSPRFYLMGKWFGPFEEEEAELPLAAAVYLLARNSAVLLEGR